jgi:hypothetical protein
VVIRKAGKDTKNKGRDFAACDKDRSSGGCGFFEFIDNPQRLEYIRNAKPAAPPVPDGPKLPKIKFSIHSFENKQIHIGIIGAISNEFISKLQQLVPLTYCHPSLKMWIFSITIYQKIIKICEECKYSAEELPRFLTIGLERYLKQLQTIPPVPEDLTTTISPHLWNNVLLPFQQEGVKFIIGRGGRGLIADEMGKKTFYCILFMLYNSISPLFRLWKDRSNPRSLAVLSQTLARPHHRPYFPLSSMEK